MAAYNQNSSDDDGSSSRNFSIAGSSVAHLVIHEGYLSGWIRKFSPHYGTGWQKRYFCLLKRDASLAYWKSVPKYVDEQPAGSINLVNVRSVDLDGGLGLVLRTISRDYRLLFDSPSDKDMWHDRILVLFHRARRRIDEKSSDAMATKFATWASLQQQKSSTGFSTALQSLRNRHTQFPESSDGMGPTTDQTDVKRAILKNFLVYQTLEFAFDRHPYMSQDQEVPPEFHIPDVLLHDVEASSIYTYTLAVNLFYIYRSNHSDYEVRDDGDEFEGDFEDHHFEGERCRIDHIIRAGKEISGSKERRSTLGSRDDSCLSSYFKTFYSFKSPSEASTMTWCCPPRLRRSASLDSVHADALRHVLFPIKGGSRRQSSRQDEVLKYLGVSSDQAIGWKLGLHRERSRSIDLSVLKEPKTKLQLFHSSAPLFPNPVGFLRPSIPLIQFVPIADTATASPQNAAYVRNILRPTIPGDLKVPVVQDVSDLSTISLDWSTALQILQRSVRGRVDDLWNAQQLCSDLDGISRFTDKLAVGSIPNRERQLIASTLYSRSSPSAISLFVECLLTLSDPVEPDYLPSTPQSCSSEKSITCASPCAHRCRHVSQSSSKRNSISCVLAHLPPSSRFKTFTPPWLIKNGSEKFLDNVIVGHLYVAFGSGRYTGYLAILISAAPIGSGKCFDIRKPNIEPSHLKLPAQHRLNCIHLYTLDTVPWPLPSALPLRLGSPTPVHTIDIPNCHKVTSVTESELGFDWTCQESYDVPRVFHEGTKKEMRFLSFRARSEREANTFRQSMIAAKLSSFSNVERSRIIRANYKGHNKLT